MKTILLTFVIIGGAMLLMSIGVIFSGRRLRGSCGGNSADCSCKENGEKRGTCSEESQQTTH